MKKDALQAQGLTRTVLALLLMVLLVGASFWVLHLFMVALLWAAMIVVSTWPFMLKVQARLWGRRSLAVLVMTLSLLLVVVLPFLSAIVAVVARTPSGGGPFPAAMIQVDDVASALARCGAYAR